MAEISFDDGSIGRHLRRGARRDDTAFRQHEHVLGQAHHRLHDVLDHDDGDAAVAQATDDRQDVADLGRVQSGKNLVEQQQLWPGRQRAGEFETLAAGDGQGVGRPVEHLAEPHVASDLLGDRKCFGARRVPQIGAHQDIVAHRQTGEGLHDLERAGDAVPRQPVRRHAGDVRPAVANGAFARLEESGDDGEKRGLAGAVGPDQAGNTALRRRQRRRVHCQ